MEEYVLGISCFYHDSAAALIKNGEIITAVQEERFQENMTQDFQNSIKYCLSQIILILRILKQ